MRSFRVMLSMLGSRGAHPPWTKRRAAEATPVIGADFRSDRRFAHQVAYVISVRTKGRIVFAAIMVYAVAIALFVFQQKNLLLRDFDEIQASQQIDAKLREIETLAFDAVAAMSSDGIHDPARAMQRLGPTYRTLRDRTGSLRTRFPSALSGLDALDAAFADAERAPSADSVARAVQALGPVRQEAARLAAQLQQERNRLSERYRRQTNSAAMTTLLLGMAGLAVLGAIMGVFFKQLTRDLRGLQARAIEIVNGYRGAPLPVARHDEVGQLMVAVNGMANALDEHEKELILERQKYLHQEKMAAIGTLAAGVAHEIGNPIAAISGIAQHMIECRAEAADSAASPPVCPCQPELILEQTERLAAITREISEFASPHAAEPQLFDLNALLRSTTSLMRYDQRLRRIDLQLELDRGLPAIHGIADQISQLIMNLVINAADALEETSERAPRIVVSTREEGGRVRLSVEDNGPGMEESVRQRVFEAFFTTKAAGKGTGLGLSLCYSIMQNHGGSIEIESIPGAGTQVHVYFPLNETA